MNVVSNNRFHLLLFSLLRFTGIFLLGLQLASRLRQHGAFDSMLGVASVVFEAAALVLMVLLRQPKRLGLVTIGLASMACAFRLGFYGELFPAGCACRANAVTFQSVLVKNLMSTAPEIIIATWIVMGILSLLSSLRSEYPSQTEPATKGN
jgi:hypothetical protein